MIQLDMPMPTNCLDCPACNEYLMCAIPINGRKWAENDVREFGQGRPEWCPMKEQEAQSVLSNRVSKAEPTKYVRKGFCPVCHQELEWLFNRKHCGFCGQAVKWE